MNEQQQINMKQPEQIKINMEDIQTMFSERDMQILQLRSSIRELITELEKKNKKIIDLTNQIKEKDQKIEKLEITNMGKTENNGDKI